MGAASCFVTSRLGQRQQCKHVAANKEVVHKSCTNRQSGKMHAFQQLWAHLLSELILGFQ